MNKKPISVENIGKCYQLGETVNYETLRDSISNAFGSLKDLFTGQKRDANHTQDFWALRNVSFEVEQGEVLGIVGRNGSGKSTLLKILSGITHPTEGVAEITGRTGSLLEVGTGFHPELTGRENVYLNGAVLGMTRAEINKKFDEIVDFAGVEQFLDTPVKRYSSGMQTRLGFAVAAHLDPEILIVDEVLAVGDAQFQKKCLGKMGDVARGGRTVLFVSHNMTAVRLLCHRVLWLNQGQVVDDGLPNDVIGRYIQQTASNNDEFEEVESEYVKLKAVTTNLEGGIGMLSDPIDIAIHYENKVPQQQVCINLSVYTHDGMNLLTSTTADQEIWEDHRKPQGHFIARTTIPPYLLNSGNYTLRVLFLTREEKLLDVNDAYSFRIEDMEERNLAFVNEWPGIIRPRLSWAEEIIDYETSSL